jgi:hypothetical protein
VAPTGNRGNAGGGHELEEEAVATNGGGRRRWPGNASAEARTREADAVVGEARHRRGSGVVPSRGREGKGSSGSRIEDWRLTAGSLPKIGNTPQLLMYLL